MQSLIDLRIKIDPFISLNHPYKDLSQNLIHHEKSVSKLLLQYRSPPPLLTCSPLSSFLLMGSKITSSDESIMVHKIEKNQDSLNDLLRSMNEE